ncbi:MAG: TM2 domain-containing protein [Spirochaetales bacterium]|nr:TM2 domain-containing protein [Spirochaetales bacterium]
MSTSVSVPKKRFFPSMLQQLKSFWSDFKEQQLQWLFVWIIFFFGGFLGLHHLYAKRYGKFVFYLLTCGGFVIGNIIDMLLLLNNGFSKKDKSFITHNFSWIYRLLFFTLYLIYLQIIVLVLVKIGILDFSGITEIFNNLKTQDAGVVFDSVLEKLQNFIR